MVYLVTSTAVELRMDLFPAKVVERRNGEETVHEVTRLLVGLDEIWVWEMVNGRAELVVNDRYESIDGRPTIGWTAQVSDGSELWFMRASGCGCGNPLRGWQPPFMTVQGANGLR